MSTLSTAEIKHILLKRPHAQMLLDAEAMHKKLSIHINGIGIADYMAQIETYEKPEALALRKRYAKSNIDLFDRLARPVDKVFCARGGGRYYKLDSKDSEKKFDEMLRDVENGYSSRKWVETFWKPRYFDDPMGLVFMEIGKQETYPTYKSSCDIYDYDLDGRKLEYVVFKTDENNVYRVVDDQFDSIYKVDGESVKKIGKSFPNYFGYVPAMIISDIPKAGMEDLFVSPFNSIIELADNYLRDDSIRTIYKFKQGFPKSWKYREMCGDCKGTGAIAGSACSSCNGTGKKLDSSVSEVMVLDWPTSSDQVIAPDVAGFITPDLEYLKYSREELQNLEDTMYRTHWGTGQVMQMRQMRQGGNPETATGRFIDAQPVNERLSQYADAAETIEAFIVNCIGEFNFGTKYGGCSITYGRRFIIEGPDQLWDKYANARKMGAPMSTLDDHLREYLEAKFQSNSVELQRYLKMARVEPFVHLTVEQSLLVITGDELGRKIYFSEWASTVSDIDWIIKDDETLKRQLTEFAKNRYVPIPNEQTGPTNLGAEKNKPLKVDEDKELTD